jgi:hypothetical protein
MNSLPATERTHAAVFDVDIPLQGDTKSAERVALLVSSLLYTVDTLAEDDGHNDVLQALEITTAVRRAMADVSTRQGGDIPLKLLDAKVAVADFSVARAA